MLEHPLNPNIACLPNTGETTRHILKLNVRMLCSHPGLKLLGAVNWPAVNLPDTKLSLQQTQLLLCSSKVRNKNVIDINLHCVHCQPIAVIYQPVKANDASLFNLIPSFCILQCVFEKNHGHLPCINCLQWKDNARCWDAIHHCECMLVILSTDCNLFLPYFVPCLICPWYGLNICLIAVDL